MNNEDYFNPPIRKDFMNKYLVTELWGGLFDDDLNFEAKNMRQVKGLYLKRRNLKGIKIVYDSKKNSHISNNRIIAIQEGWEENNTRYIRGKRYFYKLSTMNP